MKFFIPIFVMVLFLVGCKSEVPEGELPAALQDKKNLLREKKIELKQLSDDIKALEVAIAEQDPEAQDKGVLVATANVEKGDFASYVVLQGSVVADDLIDATAEVGGRILQLQVKEGESVRSGQLIAVVDVEGFQKQREELETSLELALDVYERQKKLWEQNIGSEIQYLQAKNNKERLEKSLSSLDLQLSKNKVYAPSGGVVERVNLQSGELAAPGVPIVQILNTNDLKVAADVPENYIRSVSRGEKVDVAVPALGIEKTLPVSLIGKTVDPANRTFKVEVKLPANSDLKPNLLAEMKIKEFVAKDVITVPIDWVQQEVSGKRFVFILDENEDSEVVARKTYVKIGESYNGEVIITEGLIGGEQLITDGSRDLTDGQIITIIENQPADGKE